MFMFATELAHHGEKFGRHGWPHLILMIGFLLLAGGLGFFAVRRLRDSRHHAWADRYSSNSSMTATSLLQQRFARGEIDEQEYTRRRTVLEGSVDASSPVTTAEADVTSESDSPTDDDDAASTDT